MGVGTLRFVLCAGLLAGPALSAPRLDGILTDHAVIQRGQPIVVSGDVEAGERVTVAINGAARSATADRTGRFRISLPAMAAGGPYDLTVSAPSGAALVRDLLVGDVFLCSGQSNMEMPVDRMQDSYEAQLGPVDDGLRLLTIQKSVALTPLPRFDRPIVWASAGPLTAPPFSAACFYMAQELRRTLKVPIGAVHSSWGGSQIAAWMGDDAQRAGGRTREADTLRLYRKDPAAGTRAVGEQWEEWWRAGSGDARGREPWQPDAALGWAPVPRLGNYRDWGKPDLADFLGLLWYRTEVTLTAAQARQAAMIALGPVDDADHTWINGKSVGGSSNGGPRTYPVAAGTLAAGRNVITVSVTNGYGAGGLIGPAEKMKLVLADGTEVPIGAGWQYVRVDRKMGSVPRPPWDDIAGAGTLYNAMIAPLGPTAFAGVAWYQGESDTAIPGYADRMNAMMAEWRRQFGQPALPFAIASLSAYGKPAIAPGESGWGTLRDTQRRLAEADGHAAVAITVDLGDPFDIHPGEKHEVGRRLARVMQALAFRQPVSPSGPRVVAAERTTAGGVTVRFADVTGALHARSATSAIGFELCSAEPGSCRYAAGQPSGNQVTLAGDGRPVTRVRYAWADYPVVNLTDEADLPAGPFEIAVP